MGIRAFAERSKIERPAFTSEQRKIATHFHAKYLLCAEANVVRMRFAKLRGSEQHVVPLEHVEAASGSLKILGDLRVLAKLRERGVELLAKHHNRISHELSRGVPRARHRSKTPTRRAPSTSATSRLSCETT